MYSTMIPTPTATTPATRVVTDNGGDDFTDAVTMTATEFAEPWSGGEVPAVTASTLRQYIAEMAANDPNGLWRPEGVAEMVQDVDGALHTPEEWDALEDDAVAGWPVLVYDDGERDDPDIFHAVATDNGAPLADDDFDTLYLIDGWTWMVVTEDAAR